jgi:hypothetical protein
MSTTAQHCDGVGFFTHRLHCRSQENLCTHAVLHGDNDQIVPYAGAGVLLGMCTTQADTVNADLLAFLRS